MKSSKHPINPNFAYKRTPEVILKLEQAAAIDASIDEMCFYAGISPQTYYNWIEGDPELKAKLERLRLQPVLKAKYTIAKNCDQVETAKWLLERKRSKEYGKAVCNNDPKDKPIIYLQTYGTNDPVLIAERESLDALREEYEEKLREKLT